VQIKSGMILRNGITYLYMYVCRKDFTKYAEVCFKEFGDRVKYWTTMNEANIHVLMGYDLGLSQPQRCSPNTIMNCSRGNSSTEPYLAAHHMLLAHASAARLYRKKYQVKIMNQMPHSSHSTMSFIRPYICILNHDQEG